MIFESRHDPVALRDVSVTEMLFEGLVDRPNDVVMVDGVTGREVIAADLVDRIKRFAGALKERGLDGATVAIMAPNDLDYPVVFHGTCWAGGAVTTANPTYTAPELNYQLNNSGAQLLVTVPDFLDTAREAVKGTGVQDILAIGSAEGVTSLDEYLGQPLQAQALVDLDDHTAVLPYSSGTTGLPKGVMLTHRNLVVNVDQSLMAVHVQPGEWTVAFLPFFHIYGQTVLMNMYLARGANLVTMPRFDLVRYLGLVQKYRTPRIWAVPPVLIALANAAEVDDYDMSAVDWIHTAAAPADDTLMTKVETRLGGTAAQLYGMTELSPISHAAPVKNAKPGAAGAQVASTDCRVVDPETGKDLGPNEEGELWVRGPQVMKGYHNNPEATAATIVEGGWLRTGDLVVIDNDGELHIRDRLKELIKYKGFQVAPAEIEAALLALDAVADCAVVGKRDDEAGEVPVAFVVKAAGAETSAADIQTALEGQLVKYKIPAEVTFLEAIPKTASGKILRRQLRE